MTGLTNDEQALLAAVLANPEDNLPRLVYADWLDEHAGPVPCRECGGGGRWQDTRRGAGETDCGICRGTGSVSNGFAERAEFIRVQCRIAAITIELKDAGSPFDLGDECGIEGCECSTRSAFRRRERELYDQFRDRWFPAPPWHGFDWELLLGHEQFRSEFTGGCKVTRGFISHVRGPLAAFWGERECVRHSAPNGIRWNNWPGACSACKGSGRVFGPTPALVELVRREPVQVVEVTDRGPLVAWDGAFFNWFAIGTERGPFRDELPRQLFDRLFGKTFATEDDARAALSRSILDAARSADAIPSSAFPSQFS